MAGNGGFKNALNGFDKNEVNQYISEMSKKIQEREAELKDAQEKAVAATKAAAEAEGKVDDLVRSHNAKVQELEAQIKTERRNADNLQNEVDELKRKLRNAGSSSHSGASTAEAERKSAEIIENANATARDIVEKAKKTAKQVMASAESAAKTAGASGGSGVSAESLNAFRDILSSLTTTVTNALKTANEKASGISVSAGGAPVQVEMPDFSSFEAPQAVPETPRVSKPAPVSAGSMDDMFADMMSDGGDMSGFGDLKTADNSDAFHSNASNDVVDEFDLSGMGGALDEFTGGSANDFGDPFADMDGMVTEVAPLEKKKQNGAAPDDDFAADLLAQTVPGSALGGDLGDDMMAVVRELEEKAAVKPAGEESDFDMGSSGADSGLDAMNELLGQMGSMLENAGGSASSGLDMDFGSSGGSSMADDNPWADLQNQIEALGQSAGKTVSEQPSQLDSPMNDSVFDDPKVPDADDSSIWNFDDMGGSSSDDDMNSGSDDDMSSDLFGSF